jgi:hypothetical protein
MPNFTFKNGGWETVERMWGVGLPRRTLCVQPAHPLRLKIGFFKTSQTSHGCIDYGGGSAVLGHTVQCYGSKGEVIQYTQSLPPP